MTPTEYLKAEARRYRERHNGLADAIAAKIEELLPVAQKVERDGLYATSWEDEAMMYDTICGQVVAAPRECVA